MACKQVIDAIPDPDLRDQLVRMARETVDFGATSYGEMALALRASIGPINAKVMRALWMEVSAPWMRRKAEGFAVDYGFIDTREDASGDKLRLSVPSQALAVAQALKRDYRPPTANRRDPATIPQLAELGLYFHTMADPRPVSFTEWAIHVQAAVGRFIDEGDLFDAYNQMRKLAWQKTTTARETRQAAMRQIMEAIDPEDQVKALAELRVVDMDSPQAMQQYVEVLRKYKHARNPELIRDIADLQRITLLGPDLSATLNNLATVVLADNPLNPMNLAERAVLGAKPLHGVLDRLDPGWRRPFEDSTRRRQMMISALSKGLGSSYGWANRLSKVIDKNIPKDMQPQAFYEAAINDILSRPNYSEGAYERFGLRFSGVAGAGDIAIQEEIYRGTIIDRWRNSKNPALKHYAEILSSGERAMSAHVNTTRADLFDRLGDLMVADGILPDTHPDQWRSMASYVNDLTGSSRFWFDPKPGEQDKGGAARQFLSYAMLAPRFTLSQWRRGLIEPSKAAVSALADMVDKGFLEAYEQKNGRIKFRDTPGGLQMSRSWRRTYMPVAVRREVLRYSIRSLAMSSAIASSLVALGVADEWDRDPTSTNFMRVRVGKNWYDLTGGVANPIRLISMGVKGVKHTMSGEERTTEDAGPYKLDAREEAGRYMWGTASPAVSTAFTFLFAGKTFTGEPSLALRDLYQGTADTEKAWNMASELLNINLQDFLVEAGEFNRTGEAKDLATALFNYAYGMLGGRHTYIKE